MWLINITINQDMLTVNKRVFGTPEELNEFSWIFLTLDNFTVYIPQINFTHVGIITV